MNILTTTLSLRGMRYYAYHGVLPQERIVGAYYLVDIEMTLQGITDAVLHDQLSATVNYAAVQATVQRIMSTPHDLIEAVAGSIAQAILHTFAPVQRLRISVQKETPPMPGVLQGGATFTLTVQRSDDSSQHLEP